MDDGTQVERGEAEFLSLATHKSQRGRGDNIHSLAEYGTRRGRTFITPTGAGSLYDE